MHTKHLDYAQQILRAQQVLPIFRGMLVPANKGLSESCLLNFQDFVCHFLNTDI